MSPGGKTRKIVITANGPYLVSGAVPLRREVAVPNDEGDPVEWREEEKLEPAEEYSL